MNGISIEKVDEFEEANIRPENKKIISLLKNWINEPGEFDKNWWDSFEEELTSNRFSISKEDRVG